MGLGIGMLSLYQLCKKQLQKRSLKPFFDNSLAIFFRLFGRFPENLKMLPNPKKIDSTIYKVHPQIFWV